MQPDDSFVNVLVWGDEFHQDVESPDGYTLVRDPKTGWICYAEVSDDGNEYVSTGITYVPGESAGIQQKIPGLQKHLRITGTSIQNKSAEKRLALRGEQLQRSYQPKPVLAKSTASSAEPDTIYGLTLLVDFPDEKSPFSHLELVSLFNKKGYGTFGSILDYFEAVSNNKVTYINRVSNYLTMSRNKSYYDRPGGFGPIIEFLDEAMDLLEQTGFDFSSVSVDRSRFVAVNLLYAGSPSQGWGNGLWPHMGTYSGRNTVDGVRIRTYQMTDIGDNPDISTIIHENGHLLFGWPDLYSYDGTSGTIGRFGVMSANTPNPQFPNPWLRHQEGWIDPIDISRAAQGTVFNILSNSHSAFLYSGANNGSRSEMYYIEARQKKGRHADLPDEGLLIWHIDEDGDNKYAGSDLLVAVEQADGNFDMENRRSGGRDDLFHAGNNDRFNDQSSPSAKWHNGSNSGIDIANISEVSERMFFSIGTDVGPTIEIFEPNSSSVLEQNKIYKIKWFDNIDEPIDIELWQNGVRHSVIKSDLASTENSNMSFDWLIPGDLEVGANYNIRIVQSNNGINMESDGTFSIIPEYRVVTFPYIENFDDFEIGTELTKHWEQSEDDDIDWTILSGATPSKSHPNGGGTGPDDDYTPENGSYAGNYIYTEASNPNNPDKKSVLLSPVFDLTMVEEPELSFWVHMYSSDGNMGELEVDIGIDGEWSEGVIQLNDDHGDEWFQQTIDLEPYIGERVQVRFRSVTGNEYDSDICIDDFLIDGIPKVVGAGNQAKQSLARILQAGKFLVFQNITGMVYFRTLDGKKIMKVDANKNTRVDISNLSNAVYFVQTGTRMFKFVK